VCVCVCMFPQLCYDLVLRVMCMSWHFSHGWCGWHVQKSSMGLSQQWAWWGPLGDKRCEWGSAVSMLSNHVQTETNESDM
jgi:hypothetical protein